MTTALERFLGNAWARHDKESEQVFAEGRALIGEAQGPQLQPLGRLLFHVGAEHLGRYADAIAALDQLRARPACVKGSADERTLWRFTAAGYTCAGETEKAREAEANASRGNGRPPESERGAILALAATTFLGNKRSADALQLFGQALDTAQYGPDKADPLARALAVAGNNLACELEVRARRNADEDRLLLAAAECGRKYWEVAGDWSNVAMAEYRLAMTCLALKNAARALTHARTCVKTCADNNAAPMNAYFAHEVLARALHASGEKGAARKERDSAAACASTIEDAGDRGWCEGELAKLDAALKA